nr:transmembrane protein 202 isoform X1 [Oryctolagus cuniculus]
MATKMESNENVVMTFYNPEVPKVKGKRTYQKPTLPTNKHPGASMPPQRRQQDVHQTHTYIRMFCGSLCGFSFLVAVCTSPLSWVQLLVIRDGAELYAGLWTLCSHELCWTHTPRPPYYLQFSRAASIISMLTTLTGLGWLLYSCLPGRGIVSNLDLKLSLLSFASAACLLLCLGLFLEQVSWHSKDAMEPDFLWTYHLNWWGDFLYTSAASCYCDPGRQLVTAPVLGSLTPMRPGWSSSPAQPPLLWHLGSGPADGRLPPALQGLPPHLCPPHPHRKHLAQHQGAGRQGLH